MAPVDVPLIVTVELNGRDKRSFGVEIRVSLAAGLAAVW